MPTLVALDLPGGPAFVDALARVWDAGDAACVLDPRLPAGARAAVLDALRPGRVVDASGDTTALAGGLPVEPGDAVVVATSGTTGPPRGAVLTHDAVAASARAGARALGVDPGRDRWLACLPLAHVGGLAVVLRAMVTGTPVEVHPGFDAAAVDDAARRGATLVSLVTRALTRVDPTPFRRILLGGGPPPADPPPQAVVTYGSTETGSGVVYDGHPLPGVEARLLPAPEAPEGGGRIALRGPMLARAWRDGSPVTDPDGWLVTGDVGSWAPDGSLVVHGRADDVIVTGGEKVWPPAVEAVLGAHPGVAEVAVAGRPDPEWGGRVVAWVVPTDPGHPPTLAELRALVQAERPAWEAPREVVLVDALPRSVLLGKVQRHRLARPAAAPGGARDPDRSGRGSRRRRSRSADPGQAGPAVDLDDLPRDPRRRVAGQEQRE